MLLLIVIFFFIFSSWLICLAKDKILLIFRYDDCSSRSNTELERKLIHAFKAHKMSCTFGVIPYICVDDVADPLPQELSALTVEKAEMLREACREGIIEVAQHGYSHQTIRKVDFDYTEFSGADFCTQYKKIFKGKRFLEEILNLKIYTFIPPWNSYDIITLKVIQNLGFKSLAAGPRGVVRKSITINYLPETCSINELRSSIESASRIKGYGIIITVLLHDYDFFDAENNRRKIRYEEFVRLLDWVESQNDICVTTVNNVSNILNDLSFDRFAKYVDLKKLSKFLPLNLRNKLGIVLNCYPPSEVLAGTIKSAIIVVIFFYSMILFFSTIFTLIAGHLLFSKFEAFIKLARWVALIMGVFIIVYVLHDGKIYIKGAIILSCLSGLNAGLWSISNKSCNYN